MPAGRAGEQRVKSLLPGQDGGAWQSLTRTHAPGVLGVSLAVLAQEGGPWRAGGNPCEYELRFPSPARGAPPCLFLTLSLAQRGAGSVALSVV